QDYPFDNLVELLNFERDLSRNPLFDTVFVMQNMDGVSSIIPGLKFEPRDFARTSTMFDIRFEVTEENEALFFTMDYCTSLFKAATMEQMANHFMNILQAVTLDPSIRLDTIELDHGYVMQEQHKWLETISFDF
ncbi:condensation domain-containing protein, partial [Paenibacillus dendritiformis]